MTREEFFAILHKPTATQKCSVCGKTIEVPGYSFQKEILKPYCLSWTVFLVQYLIHEGWHIRNLGVTDNHPFFCPDCWKEGTPEYSRAEYCDDWYKQSQDWLKQKQAEKRNEEE